MNKRPIKKVIKPVSSGKSNEKRPSTVVSVLPELRKLATGLKQLSKQAYQAYLPLVEGIIESKSRDVEQIEHLLDGMLGFCFDEKMLGLFKRLCRHYYFIDPVATAAHVYAYREMWDEKSLKNDKKV
jgi:hypothetical protein